MESLKKSHTKSICHECHKHPDQNDVNLFDDLAYLDVSFDDPETCPKCLCPDFKIDIVMLFDPLMICECGQIIFQFSSKMFACTDCVNSYCDVINKLLVKMNNRGISHNQTVSYDSLISEPIISCDYCNHFDIDDDELDAYLDRVFGQDPDIVY